MEKVVIRKASLHDKELLKQIGIETFIEAFAYSNTEANMKKYLEESFSDERIITELSDTNSQFFIAWYDEEPIGYLKVNTGEAQTDIKDEAALEIERIYVKAAYHGKKVGQLLYAKALEVAQNVNSMYIWLGVWEENPKAISFYRKNGFVEFGKHIFILGDDEQTDIMMKKYLSEGESSCI